MKKIMLGNEAIAYGLASAGVSAYFAYPGTPSSEVCESFQKIIGEHNLPARAQWCVNEKVAFEIAYAHAVSGKRAACGMKMVGLNVASDALMSAAYIGNRAGFVIVSADDPGFYSSQTEQDSRYFAKFARIPALDPSSPAEALKFASLAVRVSEEFEIPVLLRPVLRVCHARQDVEIPQISMKPSQGRFEKEVTRWAAVPREPRLLQGYQLLRKQRDIAEYNYENLIKPKLVGLKKTGRLVVASGTSYGFVKEVLSDEGLDIDVLKIDMPYPLPELKFLSGYETVVVFEETYPLVEEQIRHLSNVKGKLTGDVFSVDEVTHERVYESLKKVGFLKSKVFVEREPLKFSVKKRKPSMCPGCPHRTIFFALRRTFGESAVYTSDIGCYTLGLNQKAVDMLLCMGASISLAEGIKLSGENRKLVATIGDSTFLHAGIAPLVDAVSKEVPLLLVILDNATVAMTGLQPTPEREGKVSIEKLAEATGAEVLVYEYEPSAERAVEFFRGVKDKLEKAKLPIVVVVKQFCTMDRERSKLPGIFAKVNAEKCTGCGVCLRDFGCPAFVFENGKVKVDKLVCTGCGVCIQGVCPFGAFEEDKS